MKFITTLLALLFCSSALMGKKFPSLKVPNYKEVEIVVEEIQPNYLGITREDIILATKLRFLRNGLKVVDLKSGSNLWIQVTALNIKVGGRNVGCAINVSIKFQFRYYGRMLIDGLSSKEGLSIVTSKKMFINNYEDDLDKFILNYLESNIE